MARVAKIDKECWLFAWIGNTDLDAVGLARQVQGGAPLQRAPTSDIGPLVRVLLSKEAPHHMILLDDSGYGNLYLDALFKKNPSLASLAKTSRVIAPQNGTDFNPSDFSKVYGVARKAVEANSLPRDARRMYLTSSGTPTMGWVWTFLSMTKGYEAELLSSSRQEGVKPLNLPIDLYYRFLPTPPADKKSEARLPMAITNTDSFGRMVKSESPMFLQAIEDAEMAAQTEFTVMIEGESGTGKEGMARHIHEASRAGKPFLPVNCGAIPPELLESLFFGHEKGAFTGATETTGYFEQVKDGTLFLDEIGDLSLSHQVKLLRVLEERKARRVGGKKDYDIACRIISATHVDLLEAVRQGRFREDLFYRIADIPIRLPPLRERDSDLRSLVESLMQRIQEANPKTAQLELSTQAWRKLHEHSWPGNIRELESTLRRATLRSIRQDEKMISEASLSGSLLSVSRSGNGILDRSLSDGFKIDQVIDEVKRHYYYRAMRATHGNLKGAAKLLGLTRITEWKKKWPDDWES
ncbi:MAG: sigma 54-interacting transcriptional regulator [Betaproteobacteria bacterium]|nr:sigma 54-interacting transcriptional regulator [Betaproteobacteria bacterium]